MTSLTRTQLLDAYRRMRTIRVFEDRVHDEFARGIIPGFVHLYAGQEASATGICMNLTDADYISSTHRGHGHCIAKGVDPGGMIMIHGEHYVPALRRIYRRSGGKDWTEGCIALNNEHMDELWQTVPVGTPIEIKP